jgi:hypothetical protein
MDHAETLRQALIRQRRARGAYDEGRRAALAEETPEHQADQLRILREASEAADAEMARLRPEPSHIDDPTRQGYDPPMGPLSN